MPHIRVYTNDQAQVFQGTVIEGIQAELPSKDYELSIAEIDKQQISVNDLLADSETMDGVIVIADAAPDNYLRTMQAQQRPITLISHQVPDASIPAVITDSAEGIRLLMHHAIVTCGRRRIAYIGGLMDQRDGIDRQQAFEQGILRYRLTSDDYLVLRGDFSPEVAAQSLREVLNANQSFDAVIAADYLMGIAALEVLQAAGFAIPQDISVLGYGDGLEAEQAGLSSVSANVSGLGMFALRQLLMQMHGKKVRGTTVISVELIVRNT